MSKEKIEKKLTFISINELLNKKFIIPDYQRGYRWQPKQVEQLLDDLWDFGLEHNFCLQNDETPYCLQPIVVAKREDGKWEVVDGQQRLTTIRLILNYLNDTFFNDNCNFEIGYDTRQELSNELDKYWIDQAENTIKNWFDKDRGNYKTRDYIIKFYDILLQPEKYLAHFIWYNVTDEVKNDKSLAIDIFDRLNIGKIGLTNSELIKALFMINIDTGAKSESHKHLTQISLGTEWDTMEKTLQQPLFWNFICQNPDKYVTHIEYLFDILMKKTEDEEEKYTFNRYVQLLKNQKNTVESLWEKVKSLFQLFEDWYNNMETFHYVGYLISAGKSIEDILNWRVKDDEKKGEEHMKMKDEFKQELLNQCKKTVEDINLDDPEFFNNYDNNKIRQVLLLFNILTITQSADKKLYFMRFPFDEYREKDDKGNCKWDIEHIHSQSDKKIDETWITAMLSYFTGITLEEKSLGEDLEHQVTHAIQEMTDEEKKKYCNTLLALLKRKQNKEKIDNELQNIYDELKKKLESDDKFEKQSLGNLTLLDKWTNRSYQNAFFPVKRNIIINNAKKGRFIPLCTQNVFLKAYSKHLDTLSEWNHNDCCDYLEEIKKTIKQ